jgi:hypothetical protein
LVWIGPEGCRRLRLPEFLDNRYMKVAKLSAVGTGRPYSQGDTPGNHFCKKLSCLEILVLIEFVAKANHGSSTLRNFLQSQFILPLRTKNRSRFSAPENPHPVLFPTCEVPGFQNNVKQQENLVLHKLIFIQCVRKVAVHLGYGT